MKRWIVLSFFTLVFLAGCTAQAVPQPTQTLATTEDLASLRSLLQASREQSQNSLFSWRAATPEVGIATDDALESEGNQTTSSTNIQVPGVDEGDIMKIAGQHLFRIDYRRLDIIELSDDGQMQLVYTHTLDSYDAWYVELYVHDDAVIVVSQTYEEMMTSLDQDATDEWIRPGGWWMSTPLTTVTLLDRVSFETVSEYQISGQRLGTRLIDDRLILMHNYSPWSLDDDVDPRPFFNHNGERVVPDVASIGYVPEIDAESFTVITTLNVAQDTIEHATFLGHYGWGNVYVNHRGITFAAHQYTFRPMILGGVFDYRTVGHLMHFAFTESSVTFGGHATFEGHVLNPFAMDEYEGYLRLFSTAGWGDDVVNRLYVFKHDESAEGTPILTQVALIDEGIGKPRETIRSARFMGPLATVVTFELIDPFYTIDLSDPYEPIIMGELEITGFSTYQHPFGDTHIVGFGYETNDQGMIIGLKVTVYDISDRHDPVVVGQPLVLLNESNGWQYAEALHNHKALLASTHHDLFGFSMMRSGEFNRRWVLRQEYLILSIDLTSETPITISAVLNHDLFLSTSSDSQMYVHSGIERAAYRGDTLYMISQLGITSHPLSDPETLIASLPFKD